MSDEQIVDPEELINRANDPDAKHEYLDSHLLKLGAQEIRRLEEKVLALNSWKESAMSEVGPEPVQEYKVATVGVDDIYAYNPDWIDWLIRRHKHLATKLMEAQSCQGRLQAALREARASFMNLQPETGPVAQQMQKAIGRISRAIGDCSPALTHPDPAKRCQHDLELPASTVIVANTYEAHCCVCLEDWKLPQPKTSCTV